MTAIDISAIFSALNKHGVQYVVIGGVAVQAHGHNRTTMDLDVIVAVAQENWRALGAALAELEARLRGPNADAGIDVTDPQMLGLGATYQLVTKHGALDVFTGLVPGAGSFDELVDHAISITVRDTHFLVAGLDDIIAMKRASGRPRDLADVDALTQ